MRARVGLAGGHVNGSRRALVEVRDLHVQYPGGRDGPARAVDGVNLDVYEGETLALVGESGCGKTT
ncbi:MAG TPA: ATP-binding cassette domain-containing protein, partial [Thermoleophilaceae bacterium]|nr:ATP-binding cassette domain-containing protein [Thermoleophilaceae bacterium]